MKKLLFLVLFLLSSPLYSATYYIATTGNDSTGDGSTGTPWLTLNKAFSSMSGGDTLIVKDGTYTGALNCITAAQCPPVGSSSTYTIVKAQNDGMVTFDGEYARTMFDVSYQSGVTNQYWQFEGIVWCKSNAATVQLLRCAYVKLFRCGAYDAGNGNTANYNITRDCSHVLLENCYAWGNGRYDFLVYQSSHVILRSCVARLDKVETITGNPLGGFSMYSVWWCEVQNCIAVDFDQVDNYLNHGGDWNGGFLCPATDMSGGYVNFTNCIGLNIRTGMFTVSNQYQTNHVTASNCVFWDNVASPGAYLMTLRSCDTNITNCTIGFSSGNGRGFGNGDFDPAETIYFYNNVFNNVSTEDQGGAAFFTGITESNYNNFSVVKSTPSLGENDVLVNSLWSASNTSGALKYITRIESGSNLSGQGEGGVDIGANITTLVGTPGSLWGESGYNTDTGVSMWPFPNEDLIRNNMMVYSSGTVTGARGFCAEGETLTHYIWNYLGNGDPYSTTYALTTTVNPAGFGTVSPSSGTHYVGDTIHITATAFSTYTFTGWTGDVVCSTSPIDIVITTNTSLTANFTTASYTITSVASPAGTGTISLDPAGGTYVLGTSVVVTAAPNAGGYTFTSWTGSVACSSSPITIGMYGNYSLTANFSSVPMANIIRGVNFKALGRVGF